jgi:hypothetical protein
MCLLSEIFVVARNCLGCYGVEQASYHLLRKHISIIFGLIVAVLTLLTQHLLADISWIVLLKRPRVVQHLSLSVTTTSVSR